jgi:hypothetical protein
MTHYISSNCVENKGENQATDAAVAQARRMTTKRWIAATVISVLLLSGNRCVAAAGAEGGTLTGIITHFEYNWTKVHAPKPDLRLSFKAEGESDSLDYLLALPGEKVDPKLEAALQKVFPSNTATLQWQMRDGKRLVTSVAIISPTAGQGNFDGTVIARGDGFLDVKGVARQAVTTRYVIARPTPAALTTALKDLNVGDKVKLTWSANAERAFFNQVQLISRAPATKPADGKVK